MRDLPPERSGSAAVDRETVFRLLLDGSADRQHFNRGAAWHIDGRRNPA
jgi:hypothetical protein